MNKRIFFRVDTNANIGRGHLSRCLAMADMLKTHFEISFVSLKKNSRFFKKLDLKYPVHFITSENGIFNLISTDDLVCLDGYQFTEAYKQDVQSKVFKLIEINDIPYEAKHVDIIINHTPGISKEQFGQTNAQLYLGLEYALLRKSFLDYAQQNLKSDTNTDGVFICFGGADTYNLGFNFAQSLLVNGFKSPIYWVTNQNSTEYSFEGHVEILYQLSEEEMIEYMLKSKVLLIPSSVLSFEAIALRKPFFTGYFVDNQKLIFEGLKEIGLAECFGYLKTDEDVEDASQSFLAFYENTTTQQEIIEHHCDMLDGNSGNHIKSVMLSL